MYIQRPTTTAFWSVLGAAALDWAQSEWQDSKNAGHARGNRNWQERMSNTSYQRAAVNKNYWNTHEVYFGLGYGPLSFKTSYTLSDRYFGIGKENDTSLQTAATSSSKGTLYYDLTFAHEIAPKTSVKIHAGFLNLNAKEAALNLVKDYSIGLAYDLDGWILSVSYVTTSGLSADGKTFFTTADGQSKKLYEGGGVVSLTKTF